jgi:hypothetical protein
MNIIRFTSVFSTSKMLTELPSSNLPEFNAVNESREAMVKSIAAIQAQLETEYNSKKALVGEEAEKANSDSGLEQLRNLFQSLQCYREGIETKTIIVAELHRQMYEVLEVANEVQIESEGANQTRTLLNESAEFEPLRQLSNDHWSTEMKAVAKQLLDESNSAAVEKLLDSDQSVPELVEAKSRISILLRALRANYGRITTFITNEEWEVHNQRYAQYRDDESRLDALMHDVRASLEMTDAIEQPKNFYTEESPRTLAMQIFNLHLEAKGILEAMEMEL